MKVYDDFEFVVKQVRNTSHCNLNHLQQYQREVQRLINEFGYSNIISMPQGQNQDINIMDNIASKLSPNENLQTNKFLVELIFRPSIPDNITNQQVFEGDE